MNPHVKRIIEQQRKSVVRKKSSVSLMGHTQFIPDYKRLHKSRTIFMNQHMFTEPTVFEKRELMNIFIEFPFEDKIKLIYNYNVQLAKRWKDQHENNRQKNVPSILCRICSHMFYADKSERHNTVCVKKM